MKKSGKNILISLLLSVPLIGLQFVACSRLGKEAIPKIRFTTAQVDTILFDTCSSIPEFVAITDIKKEIDASLNLTNSDSIDFDRYYLVKEEEYESGIIDYSLQFKNTDLSLRVFSLVGHGVVYIKNFDKNFDYRSTNHAAAILFIDSILRIEKGKPPEIVIDTTEIEIFEYDN